MRRRQSTSRKQQRGLTLVQALGFLLLLAGVFAFGLWRLASLIAVDAHVSIERAWMYAVSFLVAAFLVGALVIMSSGRSR